MKDANRDHLGGHVVVRLISLTSAGELLLRAQAILSQEDERRSQRFHFPDDRARFILGRALLMQCLREYRGGVEAPLRLTRTPLGRPILTDEPELHFSLTHSGEWIAVAITLNSCVGADLETIYREINLPSLADYIFSKTDLEAFQQVKAEEIPGAFFRAWTGKEAYLKAKGLGISDHLKEISIPWEGGLTSPAIFFPEGASGPPWCLQRMPLPSAYLGHVVWNDPQKCLDFRVVNPTEP